MKIPSGAATGAGGASAQLDAITLIVAPKPFTDRTLLTRAMLTPYGHGYGYPDRTPTTEGGS